MTTDAMLELLRPHVERLLADDELTGFEIVARLEESDGTWDISRRSTCHPKVMRRLMSKARLTAVN